MVEKHTRGLRHGGAAKIINTYLKIAILTAWPTWEAVAEEIRPKLSVLHPPIDRLLLDEMRQQKVGEENWRKLLGHGWSSFSSQQYQDVIAAVKRVCGREPLWTIEAFWKPKYEEAE